MVRCAEYLVAGTTWRRVMPLRSEDSVVVYSTESAFNCERLKSNAVTDVESM
jgi:hypothetical protein